MKNASYIMKTIQCLSFCARKQRGILHSHFIRQYHSMKSLNEINSHHITFMEQILGKSNIIHPSDDSFTKYSTDWTSSFQGGGLICFPHNTEQVSQVLQYCHRNHIGIVPQGGNTGLCGGSIGINSSQIILSLEKMNKVIEVDENSMAVLCESGITLQSLNDHVSSLGYMIPLDLGAKGSCMIGGNVSTNAGGLRVLRYGSMSKNVLGLEVVLADGRVLNMLSTLLKDNNGYNLNSLFMGSEGTLGIITKASIRLVPQPAHVSVMLIKIPNFSYVSKLLKFARSKLGEILSAFEFIDQTSLQILSSNSSHLLDNLPKSLLITKEDNNSSRGNRDNRDRNVDDNDNDQDSCGINGEILTVIECSSSNKQVLEERCQQFMEEAAEKGLIVDAILSKNRTEEQRIWNIREHIPVSLMQASRQRPSSLLSSVNTHDRYGKLYKYDISLKLDVVNSFISTVKQNIIQSGYHVVDSNDHKSNIETESETKGVNVNDKLKGYEFYICTFGHAGDQNTHLNILVTPTNNSHINKNKNKMIIENREIVPLSDTMIESIYQDLDRIVYDEVIKLKGSISAEHGIGQLKRDYLVKARPQDVEIMKLLKNSLDPNHILNPGKVIPT